MGASTETELEDKKLRIEDAKNATFAAVEEGVVPGGGAALVHLSAFLTDFKKTLTNDEERLGAEIVQKAITAPCRLIADNAGMEGEVVVQRVIKLDWEMGYNAMTDKYENLLDSGARAQRLPAGRVPRGRRPARAALSRMRRMDASRHRSWTVSCRCAKVPRLRACARRRVGPEEGDAVGAAERLLSGGDGAHHAGGDQREAEEAGVAEGCEGHERRAGCAGLHEPLSAARGAPPGGGTGRAWAGG